MQPLTSIRRRRRATWLLVGALLTTLWWAATEVALQVQVNSGRERVLALTDAGEQLHELDAIGWQASLRKIDGRTAIAAGSEHWALMHEDVQRGGSQALRATFTRTEAIAGRRMLASAATPDAVLGTASGPVADELESLDGALEAERERARERVAEARGRATRHTVGGGVIALVLVLALLFAYRRSARRAADLATTAARVEGERGALAASARRVHALVEHASDCVVVVADDGTVSYATDSLEPLLGHRPADAVGSTVGAMLAGPEAERFTALLERTEALNGPLHTETRLRHRDGEAVHVEVRIADRRQDPDVSGFVVTLRDVGEHRRLERELRATQVRDSGTGLANRARFEAWITDALTAGGDAPAIAAIVVDLNDFQAVNESLGYAAGDRCLAECAERLRAAAAGLGRLARLAGDEFGVLVEGATEPAIAERAARTLLDALAAPVQLPEGEVPLTASAGVALAAPGGNAQDLVRAADTAVHAASLRGPGHIELFAPAMHTRARRRLELRSALTRATELDQLSLAYQPIVDITTGETATVEALLRWNLDGQAISPADFIPVAETSGLIVPIGARVLQRACADVCGIAPSVSVNVSAVQLRSPGFVTMVRRALEDSGLDPASLVLELTETAMLDDMHGVRATLAATRELGVRIALDDFGTGWSSLATLASLPIDVLKLDRSFVMAMDESPAHEALVGGVISMAERIGVTTVLEGVETADQLECLRGLGARYVQGFHLGRPGPLSAAVGYTAAARLEPTQSPALLEPAGAKK